MLEEYRREYAEFCTRWMREYYLYLSGQKTNLEIAPIYERYSDLFTQDAITRLRQALDDTSAHFETERESLRHLLSFAVEQFLENSAKQLTEEISRHDSMATVEFMGRQLTFQDSAVAIRTEQDRQTRRGIYQSRAAVIDSSNDLRGERLARLHETTRLLDFKNYKDLYEKVRQCDYGKLARESAAILKNTESVYIIRLDEALRRDLKMGIDEADRSDALYFLHLTRFDENFPDHGLLRIYEETMAGLGIDVRSQKNIVVDSALRPRKNPRAFCMPVAVPDEVMLVIRPMGGQSDYQTLLHEAGHAQHYGWTSASLKPEFKYTGDYALTETYAFLFNHLISDGEWLGRIAGFRNSSEFIRSAMLTRLLTIRRYVAKLIYECDLHVSEDYSRAGSLYAELQTEATKFRTDETEFLFDLDDSFYSANYLRAWAFEVALREYLKTRFGQQWWTSRRAGSFLIEMWETGDRYSADEMASQIGIGPISFDLLIDEFNQALG